MSLEHGAWSMEHGAWSMEHGAVDDWRGMWYDGHTTKERSA